MTLGEGRVYMWEGQGFADFFHMFIYSYIMIFVISPAQIPSDNPYTVPCRPTHFFVCSAGSLRENIFAMPITFIEPCVAFRWVQH